MVSSKFHQQSGQLQIEALTLGPRTQVGSVLKGHIQPPPPKSDAQTSALSRDVPIDDGGKQPTLATNRDTPHPPNPNPSKDIYPSSPNQKGIYPGTRLPPSSRKFKVTWSDTLTVVGILGFLGLSGYAMYDLAHTPGSPHPGIYFGGYGGGGSGGEEAVDCP